MWLIISLAYGGGLLRNWLEPRRYGSCLPNSSLTPLDGFTSKRMTRKNPLIKKQKQKTIDSRLQESHSLCN